MALHDTMVLVTNFRAHMRRGIISNPQERVARALEIDRAALLIYADAPNIYEYQKVYISDKPDVVFAGCYHVYQHYMAATVWNGMRTIRMMLYETIRDNLSNLHSSTSSSLIDKQYTAQYQVSTTTLYQLKSDIIASCALASGSCGHEVYI